MCYVSVSFSNVIVIYSSLAQAEVSVESGGIMGALPVPA